MAFFEVNNLHVEIDGKEILKGLNLTVNAGEVHAIMGPNGSGKSTLAYVLAGKADYTPTVGRSFVRRQEHFRHATRRSAPPPGCFSPSNIRWRFPASPP